MDIAVAAGRGIDFFGMKIGGTPLRDIPQLSGRYGCRVLVKDESYNEASGTFKDRRNAALLLEDQSTSGRIWYTNITTANQGFSMGRLCSVYNKEIGFANGRERYVLNVVDKRVPESIKAKLAQFGRVHEVDLKAGEFPNHVLDELARGVVGDSNALYKAVERFGNGASYASLARELMGEDADCWVVPVGEGELMTDLCSAVYDSEDAPIIVGGTVDDNVIASGRRFHRTGNSPADKLVCAYSDFHELLDYFLKNGRNHLEVVSDREIMEEFKYLKSLQINAEPSAAAAFAAAKRYAKNLAVWDKVIIINTGYGLYVPVSTRKQSMARAAAAVMAGLLSLPLSDHTGLEWKIAEREKSRIESAKRELLQYDVLDEVKAFAEFIGNGRADPDVVSRLLAYHTITDQWMRRDVPEPTKSLESQFQTFRSIRGSVKRVSNGADDSKYAVEFLREIVSEALRDRFGLPQKDDSWPFMNPVTLSYLDQDPKLAEKLRFAIERAGGKNEEAVRMVTGLHWPYYWTSGNGLCGEEPDCIGTRKQFRDWQAEEWKRTHSTR